MNIDKQTNSLGQDITGRPIWAQAPLQEQRLDEGGEEEGEREEKVRLVQKHGRK